ncbi:MAG: aminotransferase class IV [Planctomycetota bacterium]|jgi:branched-chain amino acid aminotransferase
MKAIVWMNGSVIPHAEAMVPIDDGCWLHGAGLFETIRAEHGIAFRYEHHVRRLMNSAARLMKPIDRSRIPSADDAGALLAENGLTDARLRLTVSAGSMRGDTEDEDNFTVCLTALPMTRYAGELYERGTRVIVSRIQQSPSDPIAGHKSTSYFSRLYALREAQSAQCMEALWFTTQNYLAEGSISNVFLVKDGTILTPAPDTPILPGIMRATVLEAARRRNIPSREAMLTIDHLLGAEEIFLTNVMMKVMPVISVEKHTVGEGKPGPISQGLREAVDDVIAKECEPA